MANTKQDKEPIYFFDTVTGTYGDARGLVLIPQSLMAQVEDELIESYSDSEIIEFATGIDIQKNTLNVKFRTFVDNID